MLYLILVTIPVYLWIKGGIFGKGYYHTHMVDHFHDQDKKKRPDISKEEVEKRYLTFVSHEGIYNMGVNFNYLLITFLDEIR